MDSFQDDFFEGGMINFAECFIGNFCDPKYQLPDLPDSIFSDESVTKNADDLYIMKKNLVEDLGISYMALLEVADDKVTFVCGPREAEREEKVYIKPDYDPAIEVLKYSFSLDKGGDDKFPMVLPANPEIPKTGLAQTPATLALEETMRMKGALLYDPSYAFKAKNDNTIYIEPTDKKMLVKQVMDKLKPNSFVFSSRVDVSNLMKKLRFVCLQFNPFHPAAVYYIDPQFEDDGRVVQGWYHWGRQRRKFRFDRLSRLDRIHSDVWLGMLSKEYHYLSVFDMVGNFDFMPLMKGINQHLRTKYIHSSPYCIDHYSIDVEPNDLYSSISTQRGVKYYMSYAQTFPINRKMTYTEFYKDVTDEYELRIVASVPYEINVYHKETGCNIMQIMKGKQKVRYKGSLDHFIQYSAYKNRFRVFVQSLEPTTHEFVKINELLFGDFPRNSAAVLLRPLHEITLKDYIYMYVQKMSDGIIEKACTEMSGEDRRDEDVEFLIDEQDPNDVVSAFLQEEDENYQDQNEL